MTSPAPTPERSAERLHNAITGACVRALRRQDSVAIAVSGGLDSSVLAAIVAPLTEIPLLLVNANVPGAPDGPRARLLAEHLNLTLLEVTITEARAAAVLPEVAKLVGPSKLDPALAKEWGVAEDATFVSPVVTSWELPLYLAARAARPFAPRLILGQGADEHFAGYARHDTIPDADLRAALDEDRRTLEHEVIPIERRIARHLGLQFHYPYLDPGVVASARAIPVANLRAGTRRKVVLREVARRAGLPEEIVEVSKTAAQYGSGVAGILRALAQRAGKPQNEFLTALAGA